MRAKVYITVTVIVGVFGSVLRFGFFKWFLRDLMLIQALCGTYRVKGTVTIMQTSFFAAKVSVFVVEELAVVTFGRTSSGGRVRTPKAC